MTKVSRRYDKLVKFFRDTLANESITHRVRMQAAERLSEIYARHDEAAEKAAARKDRAETRAVSGQEQQGAAETPQTLLQDHEQESKPQVEIERFLQMIQKRPESTHAAGD
jgi:hypothetical protein